MKYKKYNIHKDFEKLNILRPKINKGYAKFIQFILNPFWKSEKSSEELDIIKTKIPFENTFLKAILYVPKNISDHSPLLIYYHGGGFIMPASPHHFKNARKYAVEANCRVLFVDYPLSPQVKFPTPTNACFESFKWAIDNAKALNIDPYKIVVGGDSAGGNLSAVVCLMAHDQKLKIKPCAQMLIYPAIGCKTKTKSMIEFTDTPMCNSVDYEKYLSLYLPEGQDQSARYLTPLYVESYTIYPPTYVETAEFDCLRDEGVLFAKHLMRANVKVELNQTKGTVHGYDFIQKSQITKDNLTKRIEFLKTIFNK